MSTPSPAPVAAAFPDLDEATRASAVITYFLLRQEDFWMNRRVQRFEPLDRRRVRVTVSIDATMPSKSYMREVLRKSGLPPRSPKMIAPIGFVRRRESLRGFDLRAGDGSALSLVAGRRVDAILAEIVKRATGIDRDEMQLLFADHYPLLVALDPGEDCIVKYRYESVGAGNADHLDRRAEGDGLWASLSRKSRIPGRRLGLCSTTYGYSVLQGQVPTTHFEFVAPPGIFIERFAAQVIGSQGELGEIIDSDDRVASRAHLRCPVRPEGSRDASQPPPARSVYLRADLVLDTTGLVSASVLAVGLIVALLASGLLLDYKTDVAVSKEPAVTVIAILPTLYAGLVTQRGDHDLVRRMASGIRSLVALASVLSLAAASTLALDGLERRHSWWGILIGAVACLLGLSGAFFRSWTATDAQRHGLAAFLTHRRSLRPDATSGGRTP